MKPMLLVSKLGNFMIMSVCFFSLLHMCSQVKHFMNLLLVFELFTICIYTMCLFLGTVSFSLVSAYFCLLILCFSVSEAVMGLAVLVNCSRFTGKSSVKSFSFLSFR